MAEALDLKKSAWEKPRSVPQSIAILHATGRRALMKAVQQAARAQPLARTSG